MNVKNRNAAYQALGIDIGSVAVGFVILNQDKSVQSHGYSFHQGSISETLHRLLSEIDTSKIKAVAATAQTPDFIQADYHCDDQVAVIQAARQFHPDPGSVLHVGGEKFAMFFFDTHARYQGMRTNSSCAAGTGSFLDQQAGRLKLSGIQELARIAAANQGDLPQIASRCAVFAKTDLIHAQQEGYTLPQICDGLCHGLAVNIVNTVCKHDKPASPLILCGGVAQNAAVAGHIKDLLGVEPVVHDLAHLYGAFGAAARMLDEQGLNKDLCTLEGILGNPRQNKSYGYSPLELVQSSYPDFDAQDRELYRPEYTSLGDCVQVDLFNLPPAEKNCRIYLGLDIGSTSTKAVWMTPQGQVLAGFYTRTAGRPVDAMRSLFEAMNNLARKNDKMLHILAAGTTGSGRKFVGSIAGVELILDEITAHARAALELHPDVDTIIEIGGQDSKYTTLKNGQVTFSIMNTVCAAGTGSFLEEQAEKLGVPLEDYAQKTMGVASPIASDRCTVFMERDINYYLSQGFSVHEVLAAALHSVRENYLNKVAVESSIGQVVCFQGATAKNPALVAAFEQRLHRPIHVSPYCHLTGALGVALHLADQHLETKAFRGLDLYKKDIPVRTEVCSYCTNHCKITVAELPDGPVAFGFLCGRDYETLHYVDNNLSGLNLVRSHRQVFADNPKAQKSGSPTVGIPTALYMQDEAFMWQDFFNRLGLKTIMGNKPAHRALETGKARAEAEFCAPMTAMHGQTAALAARADYVFLPYYLDNQDNDREARRHYCYYSQFAPALAYNMGPEIQDRLVSPVVKYIYSGLHQRLDLYRALRRIDPELGLMQVIRAFEQARQEHRKARQQWRRIFTQQLEQAGDICVMLLGRPYTVLDPQLNKKIPDLFARLGIKTFFQDMLQLERGSDSAIRPFLQELHWNYAADIMKAAEMTSRTKDLYPVLVTSFNCSPDSFICDVFQELMAGADKPYLILEMDEHSSGTGYETRIEAAVRAFRNHAARKQMPQPDAARINPAQSPALSDKTVFLPSWDPLTCRLLVANMRREGIQARLLPEGEEVLRRSMRLNSGQCLPINAIAQEFVDHVRSEGLDPARSVLWMTRAEIACNIRLYPYRLKQMIASFGQGLEKAGVYTGSITFADLSLKATMNAYFAFMFGGMLRKMGCCIRPREKEIGSTDLILEKSLSLLEQAFEQDRDKEAVLQDVVSMFAGIETVERHPVQVAIFGDLYVRDNPVFNQNLIRFIESHGGQALTTPYTEYIKMIAPAYFKKWFAEGRYFDLLANKTILATMARMEKTYYRYFEQILQEPRPEYTDPPEKVLPGFGLIPEHNGESMDNILKVHYLLKHHPELSLFVQTNPSFCCPSLVSEALASSVQEKIKRPIVSITYDGTGGDKNRKLIPYLTFAA